MVFADGEMHAEINRLPRFHIGFILGCSVKSVLVFVFRKHHNINQCVRLTRLPGRLLIAALPGPRTTSWRYVYNMLVDDPICRQSKLHLTRMWTGLVVFVGWLGQCVCAWNGEWSLPTNGDRRERERLLWVIQFHWMYDVCFFLLFSMAFDFRFGFAHFFVSLE